MEDVYDLLASKGGGSCSEDKDRDKQQQQQQQQQQQKGLRLKLRETAEEGVVVEGLQQVQRKRLSVTCHTHMSRDTSSAG